MVAEADGAHVHHIELNQCSALPSQLTLKTTAGAGVPRLCQHSAWGMGFRVWLGGEEMRRDMGVLGDVAECPILHAPCPAECGLADL
ncbi:unnamed protein product [Leuciscus chuanchicus]